MPYKKYPYKTRDVQIFCTKVSLNTVNRCSDFHRPLNKHDWLYLDMPLTDLLNHLQGRSHVKLLLKPLLSDITHEPNPSLSNQKISLFRPFGYSLD